MVWGDDDQRNRNFSEERSNNHLMLDSTDVNTLYYIEYYPVEFDDTIQVARSYSNCYYYERCKIRISKVDINNFNLIYMREINDLGTWNDSCMVAINGNSSYVYAQGKRGRTSTVNAYLYKYDLSSSDKTIIKSASTWQYYTSSNGHEYDADGYVVGSQDRDRYIVFYNSTYYDTSKHNEQHENEYVYDVYTDQIVNTSTYYEYHTYGHSSYNKTYTGISAHGGLLTSNPQMWVGSGYDETKVRSNYLNGLKDGDYIQKPINFLGNMTSKYGAQIGYNTTYDQTTQSYTYTNYIKVYKLS